MNSFKFMYCSGATAVLVSAHIYTPPVFDDGGSTDIVFATIDYNVTANLQNPDTAKLSC